MEPWRRTRSTLPTTSSNENDVELKKLQDWLEKIRKLDFYDGGLATEAGERLKGCESLLDTYAQRVFDAHDENR